MPDPFSHVARGDPYGRVLTADRINTWVDAARKTHGLDRLGAGRPGDPLLPTLELFVRNATGGDLPELSVVSIREPASVPPPAEGDPPYPMVAEPLDFLRRPYLTGRTPADDTDPIGVLLEPVAADAIGKAAVLGLAIVRVEFRMGFHRLAQPIPGVTARLRTSDVGPARILWMEAGPASVRQAVVLLDNGGGGGESEWKPYRITGRTPAVRPPAPPPHTPPIYQGVEIELVADADPLAGNQLGWIDKSGGDSFSQGVRMPNRDQDESFDSELLLAIPVGQTVFARRSPTLMGYYEIAPWGGTRKTTIEHLYRVCTQCVEVTPGVFKFRTKMAIRMIEEIGRSRRAMIGASGLGEENLENNTDGGID